MDDLALERFWWCLNQFVMNQVAWANDEQANAALGIEPPDLMDLMSDPSVRTVTMFSPPGIAGEVWYAIREVDQRSLPSGEASLFSTAAQLFEAIGKDHSFAVDVERGNSTWFDPVSLDDPRFLALKRIVADRPARAVQNQTNSALVSGTRGESVPVLILGEFGDQPIIRGRKKAPLTRPQFDTVKVLNEAGENGLSGVDLERLSRHADAVNILKRLRRDADWGSIISLPERAWKGYRIDR